MNREPVFRKVGETFRIIGTVPGDFDPYRIRSRSVLYDPRPGDFTRQMMEQVGGGDVAGWVASNTLGPGDLEAIPGFKPSDGRL